MSLVVDQARIEAVCGGDEALAVELIGMLVEDAVPIVERLGTCVQTEDTAQVHELAHSLKGIAGNVGAGELRDAAAILQTATEHDATPPARDVLAENVAAIAAALERVRATLQTWETRLAGNTGIFAP